MDQASKHAMPERPIEKFLEELSAMIRARYALIYLTTYEESRCVDLLSGLADKRQAALYVWSRTQGITKGGKGVADVVDPMAVLKWYEEHNEKSLLVLKDFHPFLKEPTVIRKLRDLSHRLKRSPKNIIILSPVQALPVELNKEVTLLELPLPGREEIRAIVEKAVEVLPKDQVDEKLLERVTQSASGLTYDEIENVLAKSMVSSGRLDPRLVNDEKKQIVKRSGILEMIESKNKELSDVGGLQNLKAWLRMRKRGLSQEARDVNLPAPKGILMVGVPGCGKSLTATAVGQEWGLPLLRLDMGRIFSGMVGSSEGNMRNAIATCEAVAPCILWVDEIEKGISGSQSSGSSDGGTTSRVFGTLLTWMQEKTSAVFVVATANDISSLPPEFLRKGRFDEIFFVDLPNRKEREEIFSIQLRRYEWEVEGLNVAKLVEQTDGFSGAEIEQLLVAARYGAFGAQENFSMSHVERAAAETVPLSKTMGERIENLRKWAIYRARPASVVAEESASNFEARQRSIERV